MAIATGGTTGGSSQKAAYEDHKHKMWEAFSRLGTGEKAGTLAEEWWPYILFAIGWVSARPTLAYAQARGGQGGHPGVAATIYLLLALVLVACVIFLFAAPGNWSNKHNWAAKTATFLLGFLTKAAPELL